MFAVVPGVVQHPALAADVRHDEGIPVHQVDLLGGVTVDLGAQAGLVAEVADDRQDQTEVELDREAFIRSERLGEGDLQAVADVRLHVLVVKDGFVTGCPFTVSAFRVKLCVQVGSTARTRLVSASVLWLV